MSVINIKYIAFYDSNKNNEENRYYSLSAKTKIDYICEAIVKNSYKVDIISASWTKNKNGIFRGRNVKLSDGIYLKTFLTFGANNKLGRIIKYILALLQLLIYIIINVKKGDYVIVYHSIILFFPLRILKFI